MDIFLDIVLVVLIIAIIIGMIVWLIFAKKNAINKKEYDSIKYFGKCLFTVVASTFIVLFLIEFFGDLKINNWTEVEARVSYDEQKSFKSSKCDMTFNGNYPTCREKETMVYAYTYTYTDSNGLMHHSDWLYSEDHKKPDLIVVRYNPNNSSESKEYSFADSFRNDVYLLICGAGGLFVIWGAPFIIKKIKEKK